MNTRTQRLIRDGIPKYIRCYDNGGVDAGGSCDRYTVCFTGRAAVNRSPGCASEYSYRAMSEHPFHPQGIGMWGASKNHHCDVNKWGFAPMVGRKNHLGLRIHFKSLPYDCKKLVLQDYKEIWRIELPAKQK